MYSETFSIDKLKDHNRTLSLCLMQLETAARITDVAVVRKEGRSYLWVKCPTGICEKVSSLYNYALYLCDTRQDQKTFSSYIREQKNLMYGFSMQQWDSLNDEIIKIFRENILMINKIMEWFESSTFFKWHENFSAYEFYPHKLDDTILNTHFRDEMYQVFEQMEQPHLDCLKKYRIPKDASFLLRMEQLLKINQKFSRECGYFEESRGMFRAIGRFLALQKIHRILRQNEEETPKIYALIKEVLIQTKSYAIRELPPQARELLALPHLSKLFPRVFNTLQLCTKRLEIFPMCNLPPDVQRMIMDKLDYPIAWPSGWMVIGLKRWERLLQRNSFPQSQRFEEYFTLYKKLVHPKQRYHIGPLDIKCDTYHIKLFNNQIAQDIRWLIRLHEQDLIVYKS